MRFEGHNALIFQKSAYSRERLVKMLISREFETEKIHKTSMVSDIEQIVASKDINILFIDHELSNSYEIMNLIKTKTGTRSDIFVVLISPDPSKELLFKTAQAGASFFICKPYLDAKIDACLKVYFNYFDSPYGQLIKRSKDRIKEEYFAEAKKDLNLALTFVEKPVEAYFYLARLEFKLKNYPEAIVNLNHCLRYDKKNYLCLKELVNVYIAMGKGKKAFQTGKYLIFNFPTDQEQISEIIRLCISAYDLNEMTELYEAVMAIKGEKGKALNYIGAGLYVAGKEHLSEDHIEEALECFDLIAKSCSQFSKFIRAMIVTLVESGLTDEAKKYLNYFESDATDQKEICEFVISAKSADQDKGPLIETGKKLLKAHGGSDLKKALDELTAGE